MNPDTKFHDGDERRLYITGAQLQLFLNDVKENGLDRVAFRDYIGKCKAYNFVSDLMETYEGCAKLYWDDELHEFAFSFPEGGLVAVALGEVYINY